MSASNNARLEPGQPGPRSVQRSPTSGWYTFQHHFYNNGSGVLAVDMTRHLGAATPLAHLDAEHPARYHRRPSAETATAGSSTIRMPLAFDNITRSGVVAPATDLSVGH